MRMYDAAALKFPTDAYVPYCVCADTNCVAELRYARRYDDSDVEP